MLGLIAMLSALAGTIGCTGDKSGVLPDISHMFSSETTTTATTGGDSLVLQAGQIVGSAAPEFANNKLIEAEKIYKDQDYAKAEKLFEKIADDKHNPPLVAERARFYQAEAQYAQGKYDDAASTYNSMLQTFPAGVFRTDAVNQLYKICRYWLTLTEDEMKKAAEGKSTMRWDLMHFDKSLPLMDVEGRALKMLEQVYYNDPTGPHADVALFWLGKVNFFRNNFRDADRFLSELVSLDDRGLGKTPSKEREELRDQALELVILAKINASGGPEYDGRKFAEALQMIQTAQMSSPGLAKRTDFLDTQRQMIWRLQAQKDFEQAEFYRRTGRPASAWFCYELVCRRYKGSEQHRLAIERMDELWKELAKSKEDTGFMARSRRTWYKWIYGEDLPLLPPGKEMPRKPWEAQDPASSTAVSGAPPAKPGVHPLPNDVMPHDLPPVATPPAQPGGVPPISGLPLPDAGVPPLKPGVFPPPTGLPPLEATPPTALPANPGIPPLNGLPLPDASSSGVLPLKPGVFPPANGQPQPDPLYPALPPANPLPYSPLPNSPR